VQNERCNKRRKETPIALPTIANDDAARAALLRVPRFREERAILSASHDEQNGAARAGLGVHQLWIAHAPVARHKQLCRADVVRHRRAKVRGRRVCEHDVGICVIEEGLQMFKVSLNWVDQTHAIQWAVSKQMQREF
jgi:hypothetical protein